MRSLICVVFIAIVPLSLGFTASVDTFEFGTNEGRVTFTTSGKIGIFEKLVRIPIVISPCSILTYVRVDVDNRIGPPNVKLDSDMNTVVIQYRILQNSRSSYVITAKTVPDRVCAHRRFDYYQQTNNE